MTDTDFGPTVAVGVDDTPESIEALRYAAAAARDRHLDLLVVHADQFPPAVPKVAAAAAKNLRATAEALVDDALSGVQLSSTTRIHRLIALESATVLLRDASARASMLVLGRPTTG